MNDNEAVQRELAELKLQVQQLSQLSAQRRSARGLTRKILGAAIVLGVTVAGVAVSQPVVTPFAPNAPAVAAAVNTNFTNVVAYTVPPNAIMFFDGSACPTGWVQVAQGRSIVARPTSGTNGQAFGTALVGNTEPSHAHSINAAGAHNHGGATGAWVGWLYTQINYTSIPGYNSPYHIQSSISSDGNHSHSENGVGSSAVMPYIYYTACRKT